MLLVYLKFELVANAKTIKTSEQSIVNTVLNISVISKKYRRSCRCHNVCQNSCHHTPSTVCQVDGLLQIYVHKLIIYLYA